MKFNITYTTEEWQKKKPTVGALLKARGGENVPKMAHGADGDPDEVLHEGERLRLRHLRRLRVEKWKLSTQAEDNKTGTVANLKLCRRCKWWPSSMSLSSENIGWNTVYQARIDLRFA